MLQCPIKLIVLNPFERRAVIMIIERKAIFIWLIVLLGAVFNISKQLLGNSSPEMPGLRPFQISFIDVKDVLEHLVEHLVMLSGESSKAVNRGMSDPTIFLRLLRTIYAV